MTEFHIQNRFFLDWNEIGFGKQRRKDERERWLRF